MISEAAIGELAVSAVRRFGFIAGGAGSLSIDFRQRVLAATREFATEPSDSMPNTPFDGTVQQSLRLDRSIIASDGFGKMSVTWGELELINADGRYDDLPSRFSIDGRRVIVRAGTIGRPYDRFYTVFDGTATGWSVQEDMLRIAVRDNGYRLQVPASGSLYAGTGALEGGTDLVGKRRPLSFGYVSNVSPPLVIPLELVFQVHDGRVLGIPAVYDRGSLLTFAGDYPTTDAMRSAPATPGTYTTCVAEGYFRLGGSAVGQVTADVQGDATGAGFVSTTADIVRRLLKHSTTLADPGDLVTWSFDKLNTQNPNAIGYWIPPDSNQTVREVIDALLVGVGGWADFRRDGLFKIARFDAPSGPPSARYTDVEIINIDTAPLPDAVLPPPWRYRVTWGWNWTPQTDVAGAVGAARVAYLAEQFRTSAPSVSTLGAQIKAAHPLAQDPEPIAAYYLDSAAAQTEADRRLALYAATRSLYRISVGLQAYGHDIGDVVHVTYPRWDLGTGRLLTIVAMSENPDDAQVELTVFG